MKRSLTSILAKILLCNRFISEGLPSLAEKELKELEEMQNLPDAIAEGIKELRARFEKSFI